VKQPHEKRNRILMIIGALLGILLLFGIWLYLYAFRAPTEPPAFTGEKPTVASDGYVSHTEEIVVDVPIEVYRELSDKVELQDALEGTDGIPSVAGTETIKGTWSDPGARRRVSLDGGHFAAEEVLINTPDTFRYQVWGFTNYGKLVTDYAIGEFNIHEDDGKTHVRWTYSFHKNSLVSQLFLPNFVSNNWASFMRSSLNNTKTSVEEMAAGQG
jgi:polyketide cyclase/dehydrase/lipid transport protein